MPAQDLPSIATIVGGLLARVEERHRPLFIALAERLAAERYRRWAKDASGDARSGLLACAEREAAIADKIAALYPDATTVQASLRADNPELDELADALFAGRPLAEQFAIQAAGERAGAGAWRAFAAQARGDEARRTLLACAELEERSAEYLESLLAQGER
jgi:hypothetical protein